MQLRDYQNECIGATYNWMQTQSDNPLNVLATGTGKSVIIAQFIKTCIQQWPETRIICAIDTKELVRQNYETLLKMWTFAPAGVCSAGLRRKDTQHQILFTGIQSVYNKANDIGRVDILIIDEAHMANLKDGSMWRTFIDELQAINPNLWIVGFTATPYRMDSGLIYTGDDAIFGGIAYEYNIKQGIKDKFLSEIIPKRMTTHFDVSQVGKSGGDFIESQLQTVVNQDDKNQAVIQEIITYGKDRKGWLIFSSGCDHAEQLDNILKSHGYNGAVVLGDTPNHLRDKYIEDFKRGELRYLINNAVLTKGFDAPHIDLLAVVRPTMSPVLWTQMVGRGLRLFEGKNNCLLLDFAENVQRFGFIDEIVFRDKKKKEGEGVPPMKTCDECSSIVHAGVRECPFCGFKFPAPEPDFKKEAYNGAVLSTQIIPEWKDVEKIFVLKHKGKGKDLHVLKVEYVCRDFERYFDWICFDHPVENYARQRAIKWWKEHTDGYQMKDEIACQKWVQIDGIPKSVQDAFELQEAIILPKRIKVKQEGTFWKVLESEFLSPQEVSQRKQQELDDLEIQEALSF